MKITLYRLLVASLLVGSEAYSHSPRQPTGTDQIRRTTTPVHNIQPDWGGVRVPFPRYLGQTPPDSMPRRFPPATLLSNGIWWWHGSPVFSPDGREMYFVKYVSNKPTAPMEMYFMKVVNGEWTSPQRPSFASDSSDNSPAFTGNGNRLLFTSYRSGSMRIYQVVRTDTSWTEPQLVDVDYQSLPGSLGWDISLARDETMYFEVYTPPDLTDVYRSHPVNGRYSQFERLPGQINSPFHDVSPFVDPDEKYIIFASNRPGGLGYHDLYISFRNADSTWTPARNMGSRINGSNEDGFPIVSPDGLYLFFNSAKYGDLGYNPYWVDTSAIGRLRPPIGVETGNTNRPAESGLLPNYPNPFNPTTAIPYTIARKTRARLEVSDVLGRLVRTLLDEPKEPGTYTCIWNGMDNSGKGVSSGLYFVHLTTDGHTETRKALLLK